MADPAEELNFNFISIHLNINCYMRTAPDSTGTSFLNWESTKEPQGENAPPRITREIRMSVWMEACA